MDNQIPIPSKPPALRPEQAPAYRLIRKYSGNRLAEDVTRSLIRAHA